MSHGPVWFWQKIWAKQESGLTVVWFKWDPPVCLVMGQAKQQSWTIHKIIYIKQFKAIGSQGHGVGKLSKQSIITQTLLYLEPTSDQMAIVRPFSMFKFKCYLLHRSIHTSLRCKPSVDKLVHTPPGNCILVFNSLRYVWHLLTASNSNVNYVSPFWPYKLPPFGEWSFTCYLSTSQELKDVPEIGMEKVDSL